MSFAVQSGDTSGKSTTNGRTNGSAVFRSKFRKLRPEKFRWLFQTILANISLYDEKKGIRDINSIRTLHFWTNDFFAAPLKKQIEHDIKVFNHFHSLLWFLSLLIFILHFFTYAVPQCLYGETWPYFAKFPIQVSFYLFFLSVYYLTNSRESYYGHVVLHGCFQMKVLIIYLRQEFAKYEKVNFRIKLSSKKYQDDVKSVLLRCIKQHQILTM